MNRVRLCSSSPTRAKLLQRLGVPFIQSSVEFDEDNLRYDDARAFIYHASKGKLEEAKKLYGLDLPLLTADTVVVGSGAEILRKAKDEDDAFRILHTISGSEIAIVSCVHLNSKKRLFVDISATHYLFDKFDESDLKHYIDSGEWRGKAGACMVEGFCKKYIKSVRGLESTAMGLQVEIIIPWIGE